MALFDIWDALTFATEAKLVEFEADIDRYKKTGEDYTAQLARAKDSLQQLVLKNALDPDHFIQGVGTDQLVKLHAYLTLFEIYMDKFTKEGDFFHTKMKAYEKRVKAETHLRFEIVGVHVDIDNSGTIEKDTVEENLRNAAYQRRVVRR